MINLHEKIKLPDFKEMIKSRPNVFKMAMAACLAVIMIAGGGFYYNIIKNEGYAVRYDGRLIGYVKDKDYAIGAFEAIKEDITKQNPSIIIGSQLEFEKAKIDSTKSEDSKIFEEQLKADLYNQFTSYAVAVNGNEMALVRTKDEAEKVVDEVKKYFADNEAKNGAEIIDINIKDDLQIAGKIVDGSKAVDVQTAVNTLLGNKNSTIQYQVKEGDSLWSIARNSNMKIDDIIAANPGINVDALQLGQTINLTANAPNIKVEITYKIVSEEQIEYDTQYTSDNNLYKGQSKVVQNGQYGIKQVINKITKLNGSEIAKTLITATVVKSPVVQILARGTKDIVGSGAFLRPARGNLTSGFGNRGGELHKGVDICAPEGTPIYAADGGTVVHAGWYYGYGKLVIIDHGNGFETYYGHCSSINVSTGQSVSRGEKIAGIGHTGEAYGDHVHFEVRLNGVPQNPSRYLN